MNTQAPKDPDSLCERCKSIDFDAILSQQYSPSDRIVPLMSLERLPPGDCGLCQLFAQYCGDNWGDGILCSVSGEGILKQPPDNVESSQSDTTMLSILPRSDIGSIGVFLRKKGYISEAVNTPSSWREGHVGPRSLDPEAIDYSRIRGWLYFCENGHRIFDTCSPSKVDSEWPIRFIDCETRLVVEAASLGSPCPPFLALSYVWGQLVDLQYRQPAHDEPLTDLPPTVRDSIVVAQKIGFRYLWVDKYCIRQDDEEDKRRQIRLMAGIYGSAQMTIIAAAGSDPRYGLPGVSRPLEIRRPHARVGNRTLTWTFGSGSLRDDVSASVWSTRGWTYQEDILSARRLVFTEQQVYFQCGLSGYYQAFNVHARLMGSVGEDKILARMKSNVLPHHVGDRIHEYTHRKLGNEDDILNAFQGIFSAFAKEKSVHNVWGIPVNTYRGFINNELEHSRGSFQAGICWTLETPAGRRDKFPSWSWAGWTGRVDSKYAGTIDGHFSGNKNTIISFESPDGTRTEWSQLDHTLGDNGSQDHLRILILDSPSFPLQVEEVHNEPDDGGRGLMRSPRSDAEASLRVTGDVTGPFYPLSKTPSCGPDQPQQGGLVGVPIPSWKGQTLYVLVFHKKDEFWERFGHFEWSNPEGPTDLTTFLTIIPTTRTVLRIA